MLEQQQPQQQTYTAWIHAGSAGFFIASDRAGQRVVIARTATTLPNSAFAELLGGYVANRSGVSASCERRQWDEWIDHPEEAIIFGWLTWETIGEVARDGASDGAGGRERNSGR